MDRLNVLSIDWDYFMNVSLDDRLRMFPDGGNENIPSQVSNLVWAGRYSECELESVKVDEEALSLVSEAISRSGILEAMICDSHIHAYKFIHDKLETMNRDSINLVNIDYHHDVYGDRDDVDCGNWLKFLIDDMPETDNKFTWVARKDLDNDSRTVCTELEKTYDINIVNEYLWDIVFLCRSGQTWSPPHLDRYFVQLASDIQFYSICTLFEKGILEDRYDDDMTDLIDKLRSSTQKTHFKR